MPANVSWLRGRSGRNSTAQKAARQEKAASQNPAPPPEPPAPMNPVPAAPKKLTARGRKVFDSLAERIHRLRGMTELDVDALCFYVDSYLMYEDAMKVVRKKGAIDGDGMRRPEVSVAREAHKECLRLLTEFGLTPSSRVRIRANG